MIVFYYLKLCISLFFKIDIYLEKKRYNIIIQIISFLICTFYNSLSGIVFCCFTKKNKSSKNTDLTKLKKA